MPNLPNVSKKWSCPDSSAGKSCIDQARMIRCRNASSVRASEAGRVPGAHATAVVVASMHSPCSIASCSRYSVVTAPDRWLCRSPPLGSSLKKARSRAGRSRSESRYAAVRRSAGVTARGDAGAAARAAPSCAGAAAVAGSAGSTASRASAPPNPARSEDLGRRAVRGVMITDA